MPATLRTVLLLALVLAFAYYLTAPEELEERGEGVLDGVRGVVEDAVRGVTDMVTQPQHPARWGGGIRSLNPTAQPFFAALFRAMEARGWHPRSHYPHAGYNEAKYGPGPRALDIVDNEWARNAWQSPTEPYVSFYRDLGALAEQLGLVWGGRWTSFSGDGSAWAQAWKAIGMGDMLHVEWRLSSGATPPDLGV